MGRDRSRGVGGSGEGSGGVGAAEVMTALATNGKRHPIHWYPLLPTLLGSLFSLSLVHRGVL